jgi:hypothetical protein
MIIQNHIFKKDQDVGNSQSVDGNFESGGKAEKINFSIMSPYWTTISIASFENTVCEAHFSCVMHTYYNIAKMF